MHLDNQIPLAYEYLNTLRKIAAENTLAPLNHVG